MDFSLTASQSARRDQYFEFGQSLNVDNLERDRDGVFDRTLWNRCADFGVLSLANTAAYGGEDGLDILSAMVAMEGLGRGCTDNGLTFALNAQMWTVQLPILMHGTEAARDAFLRPLAAGQIIGSHALTEEASGSDVFSLQTQATRDGDGYRLSGKKRYITLAPVADVALVLATTDPSIGKWGITAFLVERDATGVHFSATRDKMGLRTVPIGEIELDGCFVPESHRVGPEGAGFSLSNHALEYERCCILASHLGAMERQLGAAVAYARKREQYGKPIGKYQSVSNRIAEMKLRLETSRLLLYKVAWLKKNDEPAMMEAALLKLHLSESFVASGLDAVRTFGGAGYMTETEIERDLRDAIGGVLYAGTSDIQRNIIARLLGL